MAFLEGTIRCCGLYCCSAAAEVTDSDAGAETTDALAAGRGIAAAAATAAAVAAGLEAFFPYCCCAHAADSVAAAAAARSANGYLSETRRYSSPKTVLTECHATAFFFCVEGMGEDRRRRESSSRLSVTVLAGVPEKRCFLGGDVRQSGLQAAVISGLLSCPEWVSARRASQWRRSGMG